MINKKASSFVKIAFLILIMLLINSKQVNAKVIELEKDLNPGAYFSNSYGTSAAPIKKTSGYSTSNLQNFIYGGSFRYDYFCNERGKAFSPGTDEYYYSLEGSETLTNEPYRAYHIAYGTKGTGGTKQYAVWGNDDCYTNEAVTYKNYYDAIISGSTNISIYRDSETTLSDNGDTYTYGPIQLIYDQRIYAAISSNAPYIAEVNGGIFFQVDGSNANITTDNISPKPRTGEIDGDKFYITFPKNTATGEKIKLKCILKISTIITANKTNYTLQGVYKPGINGKVLYYNTENLDRTQWQKMSKISYGIDSMSSNDEIEFPKTTIGKTQYTLKLKKVNDKTNGLPGAKFHYSLYRVKNINANTGLATEQSLIDEKDTDLTLGNGELRITLESNSPDPEHILLEEIGVPEGHKGFGGTIGIYIYKTEWIDPETHITYYMPSKVEIANGAMYNDNEFVNVFTEPNSNLKPHSDTNTIRWLGFDVNYINLMEKYGDGSCGINIGKNVTIDIENKALANSYILKFKKFKNVDGTIGNFANVKFIYQINDGNATAIYSKNDGEFEIPVTRTENGTDTIVIKEETPVGYEGLNGPITIIVTKNGNNVTAQMTVNDGDKNKVTPNSGKIEFKKDPNSNLYEAKTAIKIENKKDVTIPEMASYIINLKKLGINTLGHESDLTGAKFTYSVENNGNILKQRGTDNPLVSDIDGNLGSIQIPLTNGNPDIITLEEIFTPENYIGLKGRVYIEVKKQFKNGVYVPITATVTYEKATDNGFVTPESTTFEISKSNNLLYETKENIFKVKNNEDTDNPDGALMTIKKVDDKGTLLEGAKLVINERVNGSMTIWPGYIDENGQRKPHIQYNGHIWQGETTIWEEIPRWWADFGARVYTGEISLNSNLYKELSQNYEKFGTISEVTKITSDDLESAFQQILFNWTKPSLASSDTVRDYYTQILRDYYKKYLDNGGTPIEEYGENGENLVAYSISGENINDELGKTNRYIDIEEESAPSGYKKSNGKLKLKFTKNRWSISSNPGVVFEDYDCTVLENFDEPYEAQIDKTTLIEDEIDRKYINFVITIKNEKEVNNTCKVSGNVWEDVPDATKTTGFDNTGLDGQKGDNEKYVKGMTVKLHKIDGKNDSVIKETTTNENGHYSFEVPMGNKYYVEFVYNGYNYQHTVYTPYKNDAEENPLKSHATETESARNEFNRRLETITNATKIDGVSINNTHNTLEATNLGENGVYAISAYVGPNGYSEYTNSNGITTGMEVFEPTANVDNYQNLNLGITKRETADLSIIKDLLKADISINGKEYKYPYSVKELKYTEEGYQYWDIQAREEDLVYINESDIKDVNYLYLTYIIGISNQGELNTKVNEIVDYFDERFETIEVKLLDGINEEEGTVLSPKINIGEKYSTINFNDLNLELKPNQTRYITVKFRIKEEIELDFGQVYGNFVELTSYSTYYKDNAKSPNNGNDNTYTEYDPGEIAGRIDRDSNPGNADINNPDSFRLEDDSDLAPYAKITKNTNSRTITGVVWYDDGDGIRTENNPVKDAEIKVELVEVGTNNAILSTNINRDNGAYGFSGFIPGDYYIRFTYPDGQNYKSTKFNYEKVCEGFNPEDPDNNLGKFIDSGETNYSDARDIWIRRQDVNDLSNGEQTNKTIGEYTTANKSMYAVTGSIAIGVENNYTNIDFGLQERPKPELELNKKVTNVQVILANGTVIIDAAPGQPASNVLWMPNAINLTLDEELMYGAQLVAKYKITVTNKGETDYASSRFYYTGNPLNGEKPVTTTVGKIIDYPGAAPTGDSNSTRNNLKFNSTLPGNEGWEEKKITELDENGYVNSIVKDALKNYTTILTKDLNTELEPNAFAEATLTLSQLLSTSTGDTKFYNNAAEVLTFKNSVGRIRMKSGSTVGNLNPDNGETDEVDSDFAEQIVIMPPYGQKPTYYVIAAGVLAILAGGIFFIKKKVIK